MRMQLLASLLLLEAMANGLGLFPSTTNTVWGQTVQLPTVRNFSVQTTVGVPDQGSTLLGSSPSYRWGGVSRGGIPNQRGLGGGFSVPSARAHVTIIDLDALDEAILAVASSNSLADHRRGRPQGIASLPTTSSNAATSKPPLGSRDLSMSKMTPPAYAYMALLNHPNDTQLQSDILGDVSHYLGLAKTARSGGRWSSVQLFYEQAWQRLPSSQQEKALQYLAELRASKESAQASPAVKP